LRPSDCDRWSHRPSRLQPSSVAGGPHAVISHHRHPPPSLWPRHYYRKIVLWRCDLIGASAGFRWTAKLKRESLASNTKGVFGSHLCFCGLHLLVQTPAGQARSMQWGVVWSPAHAEPGCRGPVFGCPDVHADARKSCNKSSLVAWIKRSTVATCMEWWGYHIHAADSTHSSFSPYKHIKSFAK
jgi:hypothetical protein